MKLDYQEPIVIQISITSALSDFNQGNLGWINNSVDMRSKVIEAYQVPQSLLPVGGV